MIGQSKKIKNIIVKLPILTLLMYGLTPVPLSMAAVAITTGKVATTTIEEKESAMGIIYSLSSPKVASEVSGRVIKVLIDVGDAVQQGQIMAEIDPERYELETIQAKAETARLSALKINQELDLSRAERLYKNNLVSEEILDKTKAELEALEQQIKAAEAKHNSSKKLLRDTKIKAPITGYVAAKKIVMGDFVQTGTIVFELVDTKNLRVGVSFPEYQSSKLKKGLKTYLTSPTNTNHIVETQINEVSPNINPKNRSISVIIDFENPGLWLPGASARAEIILSERENALVVPQLAVVRRSIGNVVYVIKNSVAIETKVDTGIHLDGLIEIKAGLQKGTLIAVDGAGFLADQSQVIIESNQ
ncbi:MAG TPA: efflux RND transporter periplasmic adaptor subunit [Gammaproteobacteria bacterium]|jgi:RND family efflux transporter MFP subunit|nr:efflux RND transporter periplasmic adaptor subunit [Gammaproteobacteria bacterium]